MDIYAEHILDHYRSPRGQDPLPEPSVTHTERNLSCGDALTLSLKIEDGVIQGLSWTGTGCAISQAGMSMLSEELAGKTLEQVKKMDAKHLLTMLGVPIGPRRMKCALLSLHTLKNALHEQQHELHQPWRETSTEA